MGKTHRHVPKDGQFKNFRSNKKKRSKDRRESKTKLTKYIQLTNRKSEWNDDEM